MAASASLHVLRTRFETTDVDRALDVLNTDYTRISAAMRPVAKARCVITGSEMVGCAIRDLRLSWDGRFHAEPIPGLCVIELLDGEYELSDSRNPLGLRPGVPVVFGSRSEHHGRIACPAVRTVQIDNALLAASVGLSPDDDQLVFPLAEPLSGDWARYWTATRRHVMEVVLNDPLTSASPLCVAQAVRMLAVATAQVFPHERVSAATNGSAGEASFRRAVAFIDDHARDPITMADIATAARASADAVCAAFRRHMDTTPMCYLRRVRLAGAHKDLRAAAPGSQDTVAVIAARWGFTHLVGFTEYYREQYGCSPSDTLGS